MPVLLYFLPVVEMVDNDDDDILCITVTTPLVWDTKGCQKSKSSQLVSQLPHVRLVWEQQVAPKSET